MHNGAGTEYVKRRNDLYAVGYDTDSGWGRANALRAVYGPDRYQDQEDSDGFVPLNLPDTTLYDSIHDVPGNPYYDPQDLYHVKATSDGFVALTLDIYTWGEDLDLAIYSDKEMTNLISDSTGPNHAGSSYQELSVACTKGEDFYVKVYSPAPGNSTNYAIRAFLISNDLYVTGQNITPNVYTSTGNDVPFLKLTFQAGFQATLDQLIINKKGTLPNNKWTHVRLYQDTNKNKLFDANDTLVAEADPNGLNRVVLSGIDINLDYHNDPVDCFVTSDIAQETTDSSISLSLETYKDVITKEGVVAGYKQFPIQSGTLDIGTDSTPPYWVTTTGIQEAHAMYLSARICWNKADDTQTPPVKYNIYISTQLPFDISNAVKIANASPSTGVDTDYQYNISGLPAGVQENFIVRAEDEAGNEDKNLVVLSCMPSSSGDPTNPVILNTIALNDCVSVSLDGPLLAVARWNPGEYFRPKRSGEFN